MPPTPIRGGNPSLRYPHRPRTPSGGQAPRYQDGDTLVNIGTVNGGTHRRQQDFRHSRESGNPSSRQTHAPYPNTGRESIFAISAPAQNAERGTSPRATQDGDTLANIEAVNGETHRRKQDFRHSRESGNPSSRLSMSRTPIRGGNPSLRYPHRPRTPLQRH